MARPDRHLPDERCVRHEAQGETRNATASAQATPLGRIEDTAEDLVPEPQDCGHGVVNDIEHEKASLPGVFGAGRTRAPVGRNTRPLGGWVTGGRAVPLNGHLLG